jgi:hypothetical protein
MVLCQALYSAARPGLAKKYLPSYFDIVKGARKIANSHCLYGLP